MAIALYILLSVLILGAWLPVIWRVRRAAALVSILIEAVLLVRSVSPFHALSALFVVVTIYQIVNLLRVVRDRMQSEHLHRSTLRTAIVLILGQLLVGYAYLISEHMMANWYDYAAGIAGLVVAGILFSSTQRHLRTTKTLQAAATYADRDLPSLSVLIPARNETDDLYDCLQALLSSNYPKLEIIVLDDCSQDKRTPEIVRQFAHDGVRFIAGEVPGDNWLAKNFAYHQLAGAASGDYMLFCGVDLRPTPEAFREIITTMLEKHKQMVSVLPYNVRPSDLRAYMVQPVRYAWELSLPRRLFNRPPVLSTCWVIERSALLAAGSFKAVSRSIVPESHFARFCTRSDSYSFVRSNLVVSSKPMAEQLATAVRMRYPQLHRRPELVALLSVIELVCVVLPLPLFVVALLLGKTFLVAVTILAYLLDCAVYWQVTAVMYGRPLFMGLFIMPLAALSDIGLLNYSMYRYEFREVRWKERNICLPVMRFDAAQSPSRVLSRE